MQSMPALLLLVLAWGVPPPEPPTLRITLRGHTAAVRDVAFSPDGKTLASASEDETVKLWDVKKGTNVATFAHPSPVLCVAFSERGRKVVSGCQDGTIKVWQVSGGKNLHTIKAQHPLREVWFSHDSFGPDHVGVRYPPGNPPWHPSDTWNLRTGIKTEAIRNSCPNYDVVAGDGPNGLCAFGNEQGGATAGDICLYRMSTPEVYPRLLRGHSRWVHSLDFRPNDSNLLASACADGTVKLWDVATGTNTFTLTDHTGPVHRVRFSPDGDTLASAGEDGTIGLWEMPPAAENIGTLLSRLLRWVSSAVPSP